MANSKSRLTNCTFVSVCNIEVHADCYWVHFLSTNIRYDIYDYCGIFKIVTIKKNLIRVLL